MTENHEGMKMDASFQDATKENRTFTNTKSFFEYFRKEATFWQSKRDEFKGNTIINSIFANFNALQSEIDTFDSTISSEKDERREQLLRNLIHSTNNRMLKSVYSATPFSNALLEICKKGNDQSKAFWEYVINHKLATPINNYLQNSQSLEGAIQGYEYMLHNEGQGQISDRHEIEERALSSLRKSLADKTDEVIGATESLQQKMIKDFDSFKKHIDQWRDDAQSNIEKQRQFDQSSQEALIKDAHDNIQKLETLYTEKLKLEKPAVYWSTRARKFKKSGSWWCAALILSITISGAAFTWLFAKWLEFGSKAFEHLSIQHWQGIVLLATILSLVAFLIRTLGKLTFSSFHLQRDAEEREQLAYFYLALANEREIDTESRKIILQSLFSRSDSGLLTGDHSPTMPCISDVVTKSLKK